MNTQTRLITLTATALFIFGSVLSGWAANFSVEPVRVILDLKHQTERMVIKNESDRPLTVLVKAYRWTQTDDGKDQFKETEDMVIFPRALTLAGGEERFVRIGIATPAGPREQAYRIYLEEQPVKDEKTPKGASARIMMRVGIPVFAQPLQPAPALKTKDLKIAKGSLQHTLTNEGNSFITTEEITIHALDAKGAELFTRNLGGTYLLAGSTRSFEVAIPKDQCGRVTQISVTTRSEGTDQQSRLNMASGVCEDN